MEMEYIVKCYQCIPKQNILYIVYTQYITQLCVIMYTEIQSLKFQRTPTQFQTDLKQNKKKKTSA